MSKINKKLLGIHSELDRAKGINSIYDQSRHVIQGDALNVLGDVIDNTLQKDEDK